ncbi:MAG: FapA family protein [Candidatus Cloacimonetes bacterium]|nr:FapA family protein [Candidatus Cloacimonadota bacterium]
MSNIYKSENGVFTIEISDDKFSAFLTVSSEEDFISEKDLIEVVEKSEISFGFEEARDLIFSKDIQRNFDQPFPIAIGIKPKDPEIEFSPLFDTDKSYNQAIGNQFHLLKNLPKVNKGEPLAHLFVTKQSKAGKDIFGKEVPPEHYENHLIENYLGENVSYSQERGQIIADKTGYPYMDELPRIHIKSEFVLDKNLDLTFEDMDFFGSMIINGDVIDKVKLKLTGDLTINGNIKDAEIDVNGNIFVDGDIINCKSPGVVASGSISFHAAENSKIVAGDRVKFSKSLQFCRVIAENGLYGNESSGMIVGGVYQSGEHIETAIIGNTGGISTEVEISISPYKKDRMANITKQMNKLKELELENSRDYKELLEEINDLEMHLEEDINSMLKNQDNLPKHIIAYKRVFPATYIRILKKSLHVTEELSRVNFSIINGELTIETY